MLIRRLRRALGRVGLDRPFRDVICPEEVKAVYVEPDGRVLVTVRRTLAFLAVPEPGDLRDSIAEAGSDPDNALYESPDALEIARVRTRDGVRVAWRPRESIVPYALYTHEYSWRGAGFASELASRAEIACELRTGSLVLEMLTPGLFETAVVFKRPRWPRLSSEHRLLKFALRHLDGEGARPAITHQGKRLEWRITSPAVGDRYVCVAFHQYGVARSRERLAALSIGGRLRRLVPAWRS
jgi:hypothetical protein